jgi:hypothetical protein
VTSFFNEMESATVLNLFAKPCGEGVYPRWVAKRPQSL